MNPLIVIFSPRDIPIVKICLDRITDYDKLYIKYYSPFQFAAEKANSFFSSNLKYTHIILYMDDLVVGAHHVKRLVEAVEKHKFPVLVGHSNVDVDKYKNLSAISVEPISVRRNMMKFDSLLTYDEIKKYKERFLKIGWTGLAIPVISRKTFETIGGFKDDAKYNGLGYAKGHNMDTVFCYECNKNNIPIYVDLSVRTYHLLTTTSDAISKYWYAGIKKPEVIFEPKRLK